MFIEFVEQGEFYYKYLEYFISRFIYDTIKIEKDANEKERAKKSINLYRAFKMALEDNNKLSVSTIIKLGNAINHDENVAEGLRKIMVNPGEQATFRPVAPRMIPTHIMSLIDNYYNVWQDLDVFLKEAMLHINLMRVHPLEDGNKRLCKIITNANLCRQDQAPIVIRENSTSEYYKFINECDYEGFAKFLEEKSQEELDDMVSLYRTFYKIPKAPVRKKDGSNN